MNIGSARGGAGGGKMVTSVVTREMCATQETDEFLATICAEQNQKKFDVDFVLTGSGPEVYFARRIDTRENFEVFMGYSRALKLETFVRSPKPDRVNAKRDDSVDRISGIRDTKSTSSTMLVSPAETTLINAGIERIKELDISYANSAPESWNL